MIRRLLPAVLLLALAGCGFHLRERLSLPAQLEPVRVVSVDRYSPLAQSLALTIERSGVQLAGEGAGRATVLDILSERWGDTPISVDAFGRSQEFTLRYAVIFELRDPEGRVIVPRQVIELARDYVSNPVNAVGTEGERELLARELRREMGESILRRVATVLKAGVAVDGLEPIPAPVVAPSPADAAADDDGR